MTWEAVEWRRRIDRSRREQDYGTGSGCRVGSERRRGKRLVNGQQRRCNEWMLTWLHEEQKRRSEAGRGGKDRVVERNID